MNKRIASPLIVNIIAPTEERAVIRNGRRAYVPVNAPWQDFAGMVQSAVPDPAYDSVIVHMDKGVDFSEKGTAHSVDIKLTTIAKTATNADKAVLSDASRESWYFLNPPWSEQSQASGYAPSDKAVLDKFHSYGSERNWQEHQSQVWGRVADMMPLSDGHYKGMPDHVKQLTDKSRGLGKEDLSEFWSFRPNKMLTPSITGDDMVGMPGIEGREYEGFSIVAQGQDGKVSERALTVRSIKTVGMAGAAIPMANVDGHVPKYQIATDPSKINVMLKARAADGVSIQKSEYFDKKKNQFTFSMTDGRPCRLGVMKADIDGTVEFQDVTGTFTAHMKDDILGTLKNRGYQIPDIVSTLQVVPNAKYIWQSKGTMVGSDEVCRTVSPSNAGFVLGREPKNGADDYVVLVAEGALKGRIVAKYVDVQDKDGKSFGDYIAKNSGILVAQVPGVSKAFVESVKPVYEKYKVKGTYIAMDADGRDNLAVAQGIDTAYRCLSECGPVKVMSWNPAQKGMDDALLAVAQGRITLSDMGLRFGTPQKLFPQSEAKAPNPYRMDGTRANGQEWKLEYAQDKKATDARIRAIQEETLRRAREQASKAPYSEADKAAYAREHAATLANGGEDLARQLPPAEGAYAMQA